MRRNGSDRGSPAPSSCSANSAGSSNVGGGGDGGHVAGTQSVSVAGAGTVASNSFEAMNKTMIDTTTSAVPSMNSSRMASPKPGGSLTNFSDDEFLPDSRSGDDEETIEEQERHQEQKGNSNMGDELATLHKEAQMHMDDFMKNLPPGYLEGRNELIQQKQSDDADDSDKEENSLDKQMAKETVEEHHVELLKLIRDQSIMPERLIEVSKRRQMRRLEWVAEAAVAASEASFAAAEAKRLKLEICSDNEANAPVAQQLISWDDYIKGGGVENVSVDSDDDESTTDSLNFRDKEESSLDKQMAKETVEVSKRRQMRRLECLADVVAAVVAASEDDDESTTDSLNSDESDNDGSMEDSSDSDENDA